MAAEFADEADGKVAITRYLHVEGVLSVPLITVHGWVREDQHTSRLR
jgi:hypothetical protein